MPTKKQLQEENEKLKEKLEFVKKVKEDYFINIKDKNNDIEILEEEIEKLKEKHTHDLEHDDKVYNTIIKRLQEENEEIEKLKEENEKLKKQLQEENNVFAEEKTNMCVLLTQTIRENEKLKEENDNMKKGYDCVSSQMDYEEEEMKKCMEEFPEVSDEDCMGCRFARFRNFTDSMRIGQRSHWN